MRQMQLLGDLGTAAAGCDQPDHLAFSFAERFVSLIGGFVVTEPPSTSGGSQRHKQNEPLTRDDLRMIERLSGDRPDCDASP